MWRRAEGTGVGEQAVQAGLLGPIQRLRLAFPSPIVIPLTCGR
jgi:hypothetical protein